MGDEYIIICCFRYRIHDTNILVCSLRIPFSFPKPRMMPLRSKSSIYFDWFKTESLRLSLVNYNPSIYTVFNNSTIFLVIFKMCGCAVYDCENYNRATKRSNIRYHRFPKDEVWVGIASCKWQNPINMQKVYVNSEEIKMIYMLEYFNKKK